MDKMKAAFEDIAAEALVLSQNNQDAILHLVRVMQTLIMDATAQQLLSPQAKAALADPILGLAQAYDGAAPGAVDALAAQLHSLGVHLKRATPQGSPPQPND